MTKVRINFSQSKRDLDKFVKEAKSQIQVELKKEIVKSIERGVSPVKGEGRFPEYSEVYKDQIKDGRYAGKRTRPVNLRLTGDLLKSLIIKATNKGLSVIFDNKLADIHNRLGAGKSKAFRRMLPTEKGEEFSRSITMRMKEVLSRVANKIFKG